MNNDSLRWRILPRDLLPEALIDAHISHPDFSGFLGFPNPTGPEVAVGYPNNRRPAKYNPPCLLVLGGRSAIETLSWLKVYSPETFPLSQYARLISEDDWSLFGSPPEWSDAREDIWASIILGEALAQGEADADLNALPLSRANACFSIAVARTACAHGSRDAARVCIDRLQKIEHDLRFVRRLVSIRNLIPIWEIASNSFGRKSRSLDDEIDFIIESAWQLISSDLVVPFRLRDLPGLFSDSIEQRVVAFQQLAADLSQLGERESQSGFPSLLLAAAAFLVGRSTSHQFLLQRITKQFPVAPAWFGLIAAVLGPLSWDANWTKAAKSIERQIRVNFDWSEASGFDLCWLEYSWIASTFEGHEPFSQLPKLLPRALSIEIVPGATCQLRLAAGATSEADANHKLALQQDTELIATLSQFVELATRARYLIEKRPTSRQKSFVFPNETAAASRAQKGRKTKSSSKA